MTGEGKYGIMVSTLDQGTEMRSHLSCTACLRQDADILACSSAVQWVFLPGHQD
jgi:hypothetical protein